MTENKTPEEALDLIARGITASAASAVEQARRWHVPLVVWRDGKIIELAPESLLSGEGKDT